MLFSAIIRSRFIFAAACWFLGVALVRAELPVPRLFNIYPCGAKQGTTNEVEIGGQNLEESGQLYFSHPGITAKVLPDEKGKPKRFTVTIAATVPPGDYDVRTIGKYGVSTPRVFVVSDYAEMLEKEPNNTRAEANRVEMNTTVNGRISPGEDVDWFVFSAKKGQRVMVECIAWRIDSRLDGFMWLYNSQGKQLAQSQDENIRNEKRDPMIDFDVPEDGDYFIKLTDFTYNGNDERFYRLSFSTLPYVDYILPTGAKPGTTANITFYGRNLPGGEKTDVSINGRPLQKLTQAITIPDGPDVTTSLKVNELIRPPASRLDATEVRVKSPAGSSNAKLVVFSAIPEIIEVEPNDKTNQAQRITVPCAVSGNFSPVKDVDCFVFAAKKDEKFSVQVESERIGSPGDPDMEVLKPDGNILSNPQDDGENIGQIRFTSNSRDIDYNFTAPVDGDYILRVNHLYGQGQGGMQYAYRLEIERDPVPDFRLVCQPAQEILMDSPIVYQGGRQRLDILVWRLHGHNEPITVEAHNLPPGVTAEPIVIGPGVKWGTLVVSAKPDAPLGEGEIEIVGTSEVRKEKQVRKARGGVIVWDTVNTPAISRMTRNIMLAVREKAPFTVTAAPVELKAVQGDSVDVTVNVKRREDMPNVVELNGSGYQLPPGLEIPVTKVDGSQSEAKLTLKTDKIPPGTYSFLINGDGQVPVNKNNVRCVYPSNTIKITIEAKKAK